MIAFVFGDVVGDDLVFFDPDFAPDDGVDSFFTEETTGEAITGREEGDVTFFDLEPDLAAFGSGGFKLLETFPVGVDAFVFGVCFFSEGSELAFG